MELKKEFIYLFYHINNNKNNNTDLMINNLINETHSLILLSLRKSKRIKEIEREREKEY